jgi:multidrug resistance protein, MATE family
MHKKVDFNRWKALLAIAWPLIIANSFWNLQLTIDRIFLGMYSTEALGAAMAVMGVFWVPMALLQQTASYITTFVAQYYGAGEKEKIGACIWQAFYVSIGGGLLFLLLNFLSPAFFAFVGHAPAIQAIEVEYFNSIAYSALPTALVAAISGFFTGLGNTRTVIWINFVGMLLNAILDYLLIFGNFGFPAMGAAGAGYATAIATYGAAAMGIYLIFTKENDRVYRMFRSWQANWALMKEFLKFGLPSGMQWALEGLAFTVFLIIMGRLPNGEAALASSSIAVTIMMISVLPSMGIAQAVMTLVGQNLGDKNPKRAEQAVYDGIQVTCIYMFIVAMSFVFIPHFYLSWFKNEQNMALWSAVSILAPQILKIVALFTVFDSIYLNVSFALKGAGDTRFVSLVALTVPWPLMVLPAYLLMNTEGAVILAWASCALYAIAVTAILFWRFRQGRWKTMSVIRGLS